jgi:hypothetical protein
VRQRLAEDVMGPPNRDSRNKKDWRWGKRGGVSLCTKGRKRSFQ